VLTDAFPGLERFFEPGTELLIARSSEEVVAALQLPPSRLAAVAQAGQRRVLAEHSADHRADQLLAALTGTNPRSLAI
jgi:spore maturation protein CgeB